MTTHLRVYVPIENTKNDDCLTDNAQRAINLFQGCPPDDLKVTVSSFAVKNSSDCDRDFMIVRQALLESYNEDEKAYVIVCKDTSISCASSASILDITNQVIKRDLKGEDTSFDLYYMAKWFDECNLYTNKCELEGRGIFVADTFNPRGIQCIMFSPRGVNKFLRLPLAPKGHQLSNILRNRIVSRCNLKPDNGKYIGAYTKCSQAPGYVNKQDDYSEVESHQTESQNYLKEQESKTEYAEESQSEEQESQSEEQESQSEYQQSQSEVQQYECAKVVSKGDLVKPFTKDELVEVVSKGNYIKKSNLKDNYGPRKRVSYNKKECEKFIPEFDEIQFVAVTTYPSQIQFDIRCAKNDSDYSKTQECAPICGPSRPEKCSSTMAVFIFIVIAAIILIGIYCLLQYGLTKPKEMSTMFTSVYSSPTS